MSHKVLETETQNLKDLENVIARAINKIGAKRESVLCRYIPMPGGGYMHHFTWKKKKYKQPQELRLIIEESIINASQPVMVKPKRRARWGSGRKPSKPITFTPTHLEKLITMAHQAGNKEVVSLLSSQLSLKKCKRELIVSIKNNQVASELWNLYVKALSREQSVLL